MTVSTINVVEIEFMLQVRKRKRLDVLLYDNAVDVLLIGSRTHKSPTVHTEATVWTFNAQGFHVLILQHSSWGKWSLCYNLFLDSRYWERVSVSVTVDKGL